MAYQQAVALSGDDPLLPRFTALFLGDHDGCQPTGGAIDPLRQTERPARDESLLFADQQEVQGSGGRENRESRYNLVQPLDHGRRLLVDAQQRTCDYGASEK